MTNRLFKVTHIQQIGADVALNRYFYYSQDTAASSIRMAQAWVANVFPRIRAFQVGGVVHKYVLVQEVLTGGDDYAASLADLPGSNGTLPRLPNQNTISVALVVKKLGLFAPGNGRKSYAGLGRDSQQDGLLTTTVSGLVTTMLPYLVSVFITPEGAYLVPVVVRFLNTDLGLYAVSIITSAILKGIGSQDTRRDSGTNSARLPDGVVPEKSMYDGTEGLGFDKGDPIESGCIVWDTTLNMINDGALPKGGYLLRGATGLTLDDPRTSG